MAARPVVVPRLPINRRFLHAHVLGQGSADLEKVARDVIEDDPALRADSLQCAERDQPISSTYIEDGFALSDFRVLENLLPHWGERLEVGLSFLRITTVPPTEDPLSPTVSIRDAHDVQG